MSEITFSDVLIKPQFSDIVSRSCVDLTTNLGNFKLQLPIISANMKHVTGKKMAIEMAQNGGMGILHRFNEVDEAIREYAQAQNSLGEGQFVGVSLGVKDGDKHRADKLYSCNAHIFCVDVAHGHHIHVKNMIKWLRSSYKKSLQGNPITIIAGNVATSEGALDLYDWGADIIKVGIGPGEGCYTRKNCGVGVAQFEALKEIRTIANKKHINLKLISDGGIKNTGDLAKALIYADAVMVGVLLAGTTETPGKVYENEQGFYKIYGGSASGENKEANGQDVKFVEGVMKTVPFRGHVKYILNKAKEGLQSAFSYSGAKNLKEFHKKTKWAAISGGARSESKI